jgi:hypothetical protein
MKNPMNRSGFRCWLIIALISVLMVFAFFYLAEFNHPKENAFQEYLSSKDVNKTIELYRNPLTKYPFKLGSFINLGLRNKSKEIVVIPALNLGVRLFVIRDGSWFEIENTAQNLFTFKTSNNTYSSRKPLPTDMYYLTPRGMEYEGVVSDGFMVVSAIPGLNPSDLPTTLRFMVTGTIYRDGQPTNEQVIAYMDIKIIR